jgi:hypothetical protein
MTTVTIDISEQQAAALTAKAKAQGLTLEDWFRQMAEKEAPSTSVAQLQQTNPEEWLRHFDAFIASLDPNTPVLSDDAMSRESIYLDRS